METDEREGLTSASGFDRVVHCAGSPAAEKAVGDVPHGTSEVAQTGTDIHAAVAAEDLSELGIKEEDVAARLTKMNEEALADWKKDFGVTDCEVFKETRFWVMASGKKVTSCRVDFAAVSKDGQFCLVIDDKTGFKEVTRASANWQLKVGLVALDQQFPTGFSGARVAIAQHRLGSRFDACDYGRDDIDQARKEILFFARRADNPDAERVPGEWCTYCRAKTQCREHTLYAMMPMLRAKMLDTPKKADVYARVALLPLDALAFIESRRTIAVNLFEAVKERLKALPSDQLKALGYELKPGGNNRVVSDLEKLWVILAGNNLCSAEEFRQMCDISFGAMEEKLVPRIRLVQELESNDAAKSVLDSLIEPAVTLVPKSGQLKVIK